MHVQQINGTSHSSMTTGAPTPGSHTAAIAAAATPDHDGSLNLSDSILSGFRSTFPVLDESSFEPNVAVPGADNIEDDCSSSDGGCELDGVRDGDMLAAANPPTRREKLHKLKEETKTAITLGLVRGKETGESGAENALNESPKRSKLLELVDSATPLVTRAATVAAHPKEAIKQTVTGSIENSISDLNKPYVERDTDAAYVAAHEKRDWAIRSGDLSAVKDAERTIQELQNTRKGMRVGLIMRKQIHKARVVLQPQRPFPEKHRFLIRDGDGNIKKDDAGVEQVDWMAWAGQLLLYLSQDFSAHYIEDWRSGGSEPLDPKRLRKHLGRLFIASGPWQQFALHIRKVYRWEDPPKTFRWLCLYAVLWHTSHLVGFVYGYIVLATLYRYFCPSHVDEIREANERARHGSMQALRFDQLIEKNGSEGWLMPLASELGPWAQLQLADFASFLEVVNNFYEWAAPRVTVYTLVFFSTCFLITLLGDMEICMRIVFFIAGVVFFFSFPISSRWPKYRYLVSPLKWVFWNIPTNAEWAFAELRLAAQNRREAAIGQKLESFLEQDEEDVDIDECDESDSSTYESTASNEPDMLHLGAEAALESFSCRQGMHRGTLVIYSHGLRFTTKNGETAWDRPWSDVKEICKAGSDQGLKSTAAGLEITLASGLEDSMIKLWSLGKKRDQAFCSIIAYSRLRWQWAG